MKTHATLATRAILATILALPLAAQAPVDAKSSPSPTLEAKPTTLAIPTPLTPEEDRALLMQLSAAQSDQINWLIKLGKNQAGANDQETANKSNDKYVELLQANRSIHKADSHCQWQFQTLSWILVAKQNDQLVATPCPLAEESKPASVPAPKP